MFSIPIFFSWFAIGQPRGSHPGSGDFLVAVEHPRISRKSAHSSSLIANSAAQSSARAARSKFARASIAVFLTLLACLSFRSSAEDSGDALTRERQEQTGTAITI